MLSADDGVDAVAYDAIVIAVSQAIGVAWSRAITNRCLQLLATEQVR